MDAARVVAGEARHRLDALPVRDRHELSVVRAILAQQLDGERLLLERPDAFLVQVPGVFVRLGGDGAAAPDAGDLRCQGFSGHRALSLRSRLSNARPRRSFAQWALARRRHGAPLVRAAPAWCDTAPSAIGGHAMRRTIAILVILLAAAGGASAETLKVAVAQRGFWNSSWVEFAQRQGF